MPKKSRKRQPEDDFYTPSKRVNYNGGGGIIQQTPKEVTFTTNTNVDFFGDGVKTLCLECLMMPCTCGLLKTEMKLEYLKKRETMKKEGKKRGVASPTKENPLTSGEGIEGPNTSKRMVPVKRLSVAQLSRQFDSRPAEVLTDGEEERGVIPSSTSARAINDGEKEMGVSGLQRMFGGAVTRVPASGKAKEEGAKKKRCIKRSGRCVSHRVDLKEERKKERKLIRDEKGVVKFIEVEVVSLTCSVGSNYGERKTSRSGSTEQQVLGFQVYPQNAPAIGDENILAPLGNVQK